MVQHEWIFWYNTYHVRDYYCISSWNNLSRIRYLFGGKTKKSWFLLLKFGVVSTQASTLVFDHVPPKKSKFVGHACLNFWILGHVKNSVRMCLQNIKNFIQMHSNWYICICIICYLHQQIQQLTICWTKLVSIFSKVDILSIIPITRYLSSSLEH
jgi:hypothetical protein